MESTTVDMSAVQTMRSWWPAAALLPDRTVWHRVRVYATTAGLLIYRRPPVLTTAEWGALTPDWFSPIDLAATPTPAASQLPGTAWDIRTEAGLVVITYVGGCACGSALKRWRPAFSTRVIAWPST